jgi:hypothetical protein
VNGLNAVKEAGMNNPSKRMMLMWAMPAAGWAALGEMTLVSNDS